MYLHILPWPGLNVKSDSTHMSRRCGFVNLFSFALQLHISVTSLVFVLVLEQDPGTCVLFFYVFPASVNLLIKV